MRIYTRKKQSKRILNVLVQNSVGYTTIFCAGFIPSSEEMSYVFIILNGAGGFYILFYSLLSLKKVLENIFVM
jgi:hypothetical protein